MDLYEKQRLELASMSRNLFIEYLERKLRHREIKNLNIDIFVPDYGIINTLKKSIDNHRAQPNFKKKFIPLVGMSGVAELTFEVNKSPEGLIGRCYNKRGTVIRCPADNLILNGLQIDYANRWKFWMCVPFIADNEVVLIASITCPNDVTLTDKKASQISGEILDYLQDIYKGIIKQ